MKRIIVATALVILAIGSYKAQQTPLYSQYMLNGFLLNPGMAGSVDYIPIRLTVRQQWVGIEDAPMTQAISGHYLFNNKKMGLGGYIYNDMFGPIRTTGLQACYSYHLTLGTNHKLGLGLGVRGYQFAYDESKLTVIDESDPVYNQGSETVFMPDADFGAYFYDNEHRYFAGLSATQLIELDIQLENEANKNSMVRHYYLTGGYKFSFGEKFDLEPSILAKGTEMRSPFQLDFNVKAYYMKNYWLGVSYRSSMDIVAILGIKVDKYFIGYAFDYPFSNIHNYS
ncbi:MAG: type IX secretion system membrane protein PorP/SprF, partial [Bacteroidota bacterium]